MTVCFSMNIYRISRVSEFRLNALEICVHKNGGISEFFRIDNWKKSVRFLTQDGDFQFVFSFKSLLKKKKKTNFTKKFQSFHLSKDNITKQYYL